MNTTRRFARTRFLALSIALGALAGCAEGGLDEPLPGDRGVDESTGGGTLTTLPSEVTDSTTPAESSADPEPTTRSAPSDLTASAAGDTHGGRSLFLDGFFPLAADYQPAHNFERWRHRGVNTVIRVPGDENVEDWTHEANRLGLRMIRQPRNDPRRDRDERNLLAWHWMDEPELHGATAEDLRNFRHHMHDIDPSRPIIVNFWGGGMIQADSHGVWNGHEYPNILDEADWASNDIYPCNKYDCRIGLVGRTVHLLRRWGEHQPAFAYIETSDWDGNGSGPSPRTFRAEVWDAIVHGARGIFYFTVRIASPCSSHCLRDYDATPNDVADEITQQDALITRLAPTLQSGINPDSASMHVADPLEVGWRRAADGSHYFFVVNTSRNARHDEHLALHGVHPSGVIEVLRESRNVRANGDNEIVDDFEPFDVHLYRVER